MIDRVISRILEDNVLGFRLLRWLLYGRNLRETIAELKAKDDFRVERLRRLTLYGWLAHVVLVSGAAFTSVYLWMHWDRLRFTEKIILLFLGGGCAVLEIVGWRDFRGGSLVIVATGAIENGRIHFAEYWPPRGGWWIHYHFLDPDNTLRNARHCLGYLKRTEMEPRKGDPILVFFSRDNTRVFVLYVPKLFSRTCISWSRFRQLADLPFIRR